MPIASPATGAGPPLQYAPLCCSKRSRRRGRCEAAHKGMSHAKTAASTIESGTATSRQASTIRVSLSLNIRCVRSRDGMFNSPGEVPNNNLKPDEPTGVSRQDKRCKTDANEPVSN